MTQKAAEAWTSAAFLYEIKLVTEAGAAVAIAAAARLMAGDPDQPAKAAHELAPVMMIRLTAGHDPDPLRTRGRWRRTVSGIRTVAGRRRGRRRTMSGRRAVVMIARSGTVAGAAIVTRSSHCRSSTADQSGQDGQTQERAR